jgi:hypothetical protein
MSPHDSALESDPAFRALRARIDALEADTDCETRLARLERVVRTLARETERQRAVLESVLDEDGPRVARESALDALLADLPEHDGPDRGELNCTDTSSESPRPCDSPPDSE